MHGQTGRLNIVAHYKGGQVIMESFITTIALIAVMGLLMGCSEIPQKRSIAHLKDGRECYTLEDSKSIPVLYCGDKIAYSIPMEALR